jgi:hypothetical protein
MGMAFLAATVEGGPLAPLHGRAVPLMKRRVRRRGFLAPLRHGVGATERSGSLFGEPRRRPAHTTSATLKRDGFSKTYASSGSRIYEPNRDNEWANTSLKIQGSIVLILTN